MKITKILASEATPAKAILNRAQHVALTSLERDNLPGYCERGDCRNRSKRQASFGSW